jgi:hypothetical protein
VLKIVELRGEFLVINVQSKKTIAKYPSLEEAEAFIQNRPY